MKRNPNWEYPDPTPVEWPVGVEVPETMEQKIARMIRVSVSQAASEAGAESFEEADDFDVDDPEALPESIHELDDDQERIMRDQVMVRRIPPEFRAAFERERARARERGEDLLTRSDLEVKKKTSTPPAAPQQSQAPGERVE